MNNNNEWQWGEPEKTLDSISEPSLDQNRILGKRYLCCGMDAEMRSFDKGDWVSYADYAKLRMERIHDLNQIGGLQEDNARLKAEVERLTREQRMKAIPVEAQLIDRIAELKAEVERLRKAGDAMALNLYIPIQYEIYLKLISDWNAAKEGKHL